jgi:hypothetical protein
MNQNDNVVAAYAWIWPVMIAGVFALNAVLYTPCWLGWKECPGAVVQSDDRNADDLEDGTLREASRVRRPGV